MKKFLLPILLAAVTLELYAGAKAEFLYDVDFAAYFDNREYARLNHEKSRTLGGIRLQPEIGVGFTDSVSGTSHRLMAGAAYVQPFGLGWSAAKIKPTAYYHFRKGGFEVLGGFVPYHKLIEPMPLLFQSEELTYYTPNLQGFLFQYQSRKGFVELFLDWRGGASADTREAFRVMFNGRWRVNYFYLGSWVQYNHLAGHDPWIEGDGVCDDIVLNPYLGFDLGKSANVDSLDIRIGYIGSYEADRNAGTAYFTHAFQLDLYFRWRFLGLKNSIVMGFGKQPPMPLYQTYGSLLNQGDPMYASRMFDRLDVFFYIYSNSFVNCFASINLTYDIEQNAFGWSQQLTAQFRLSGIKNKGSKLRNLLPK